MRPGELRTVARFLIAGGVNTLFGLAVYAAAVWLGAPVWLALLVSMILGTAFNFFSIGGYAFRDLARQRLPRFVSAYLMLYGLNLALLRVIRPWVEEPILAQCLLAPLVAGVSYLTMSRWVFRTRPPRGG